MANENKVAIIRWRLKKEIKDEQALLAQRHDSK